MHHITRGRLVILAALCCLFSANTGPSQEASRKTDSEKTANLAEFEKTVKPFFAKYCFECHGAKGPEFDIRLDLFSDEASLQKGLATFEKVEEVLSSRTMPPKKKAQPGEEELRPVLAWLESNSGTNCTGPRDPGRVTIRRLNRTEYNNTIRDLLGINFKPGDAFPEDSAGHGFDNNADVLTLAPLLMEKYLTAADQVLAKAIFVDPVLPPPSKRYGAVTLDGTVPKPDAKAQPQPAATGRGRVPAPSRLFPYNGEVHTDHDFPVDGDYVVRFRGYKQGGTKPQVSVSIDGKALPQKITVGEDQRNTSFYATKSFRMVAGQHRVEVTLTNGSQPPADGAAEAGKAGAVLGVEFVEVEGPLAVTPERMPESYRKVMVAFTSAKVTKSEAAEKVLRTFATRAYRRPVRDEEMKRLMGLWRSADAAGDSFEKSIHYALQAVLTSPHFLFRVELDPQPGEANNIHTLNEYELASRLSYFLWSSMPDEELFALAAKEELRKNLDSQVKRMLKDSKSRAVVENFAGQWLQLRLLYSHTPDAAQFPDWDEPLRMAMIRETELFFDHVMREDRNMLEFLDADYTFVNERLAKHYGIKGVTGEQFRRVERAGGLLAQASILTLTSYPDRTSPVQRGKWVLETLLGTPPPPPPPDVTPLADQKELKGTLRQRMEQHRVNPACASCHQRMDPIGFGLENFDAIGRWRTTDGKDPIDPTGTLPSGKSFNGPSELKGLLKSQSGQFGRCISDRMLTYALGRGLTRGDRCTVNDIAAELEKNQFRFTVLITEIVKSDPFQKRTGKRSEK